LLQFELNDLLLIATERPVSWLLDELRKLDMPLRPEVSASVPVFSLGTENLCVDEPGRRPLMPVSFCIDDPVSLPTRCFHCSSRCVGSNEVALPCLITD
jgi:hypothetical protein